MQLKHRFNFKNINRKVLILSICCLMIAFCAFGCGHKNVGYESISMAQAMEQMESGDAYTLVDVRSMEEYTSGHIPGAICIPNESIDETVTEQLPDTDADIMVYCRTGRRSKQAAGKLAELGYTNVLEIGGISSWNGDVISGNEPY